MTVTLLIVKAGGIPLPSARKVLASGRCEGKELILALSGCDAVAVLRDDSFNHIPMMAVEEHIFLR